jgi:hypothetical protein
MRVAGLDPLEGHIGALLSPATVPGDRALGVRVIALQPRALEVWSRQPSFAALRESGVSVLTHSSRLGAIEQGREAVPLLALGDELLAATWVGEGRSTAGSIFDPLLARYLTVTALPDADTSQPPVARWAADGTDDAGAEVIGVWLAGDDAPVAAFDLERQLRWLLGGRVHSIWLTGELTSITAARVTPGPPLLATEPEAVGADWVLDLGEWTEPQALEDQATWRLGLLDLERLDYVELSMSERAGGRLVFEGAATWSRERLAAGSDLVWCLDLVLDGVTLARATDRTSAVRSPAPERD